MYADFAAVSGLIALCHAYTKSFAVTGSPFDHFASSRNVNVYFYRLLTFKFLRYTGTSLSSFPKLYKPSIVLVITLEETASADNAGSIVGISCVSIKLMTCFAPLFPLSPFAFACGSSFGSYMPLTSCSLLLLILQKLESFFHTSTLHKNVSPFIFKQKKYIYVLTIHIIHTNIFFVYLYSYFIKIFCYNLNLCKRFILLVFLTKVLK